MVPVSAVPGQMKAPQKIPRSIYVRKDPLWQTAADLAVQHGTAIFVEDAN